MTRVVRYPVVYLSHQNQRSPNSDDSYSMLTLSHAHVVLLVRREWTFRHAPLVTRGFVISFRPSVRFVECGRRFRFVRSFITLTSHLHLDVTSRQPGQALLAPSPPSTRWTHAARSFPCSRHPGPHSMMRPRAPALSRSQLADGLDADRPSRAVPRRTSPGL